MTQLIADIFRIGLANPMMNFLIILNNLCFGSFGMAIIAFTIVIKLLTFPLTLRQLHSTRSMQELQPRIKDISSKYTDPKRRPVGRSTSSVSRRSSTSRTSLRSTGPISAIGRHPGFDSLSICATHPARTLLLRRLLRADNSQRPHRPPKSSGQGSRPGQRPAFS